MEILSQIIDIFFHIDTHLAALAASMGAWLYALLFVIIFCETGLVITPFLPGDSLLFAVGALSSVEGSSINVWAAFFILFIAAVLGDAANYSIGRYIGPKIFTKDTGKLLNKKHLLAAHAFYEKHGGKTILLARFIPIIRTFAPFVAGIGKMSYLHFAMYNITGAFLWVFLFVFGGHYFAATPLVKNHFHYVIVAIIFISLLPAVWEYFKAKKEAKKAKREGQNDK